MKKYTAMRELECLTAGLSSDVWRDGADRPEDSLYGSADEVSRLRLREISRKYGLSLCTNTESDADVELPTVENAENVSTVYCFDEGIFGISGRLKISGWKCDFVYEECPAGVMGFWSNGGYILDKYSQWRYTAPCGKELFIDMGPADSGGYSGFRQVLLYWQDGDRIITVRGSVPNGRDGAEAFAECFISE